ncbi:hypothetical protein COY87_00245, partial [Candidatus Roizmanbacteria bacterium CG_4_10_14_0_8_um_filter_33_9]
VTIEQSDYIIIQINGSGPQIIERRIFPKTHMYLDRGENSEGLSKVLLPTEMQMHFNPLHDFDALRLAIVADTLGTYTGQPQRIEFSAGITRDGGIAPYINETLPFEIPEKRKPTTIKGQVIAQIKTLEDIGALKCKLKRRAVSKDLETMVILDSKITTSPNLLSQVLIRIREIQLEKQKYQQPGERPFEVVFLYPGSKTEHAFKVLATEYGMRGYPIIKGKKYKVDDVVSIWTNGVDHQVTNLTRAGNKYAVCIAEWPNRLLVKKVGNKAEGLQILIAQGEKVPKAIVLTSDFFHATLKENRLSSVWDLLLTDLPTKQDLKPYLKERFRQIKEGLQALPNKEWMRSVNLIRENFNGAADKHLISRSTALVEDLTEKSLTGAFLTIPNVRLNENAISSGFEMSLKDAVLEVMRSPFSDEFADFICTLPPDEGRAVLAGLIMPVLVMQQIEAEVSGTIFHMDTITKSTNLVTIQAQDGVGGVVGGDNRGRTLTVIFDSTTGEILSRTLENGVSQQLSVLTTREATLLTEEEAKRLFVSARTARQSTGEYPDMEWCIGPDELGEESQMWFVQFRPLRTSKKDQEK